MRVVFRTNIDVAQRQVAQLTSYTGANPLIGDTIVVYEDSSFVLQMKVVSRKWISSDRQQRHLDTLEIELGIMPHYENISNFTKFMNANGFYG